MTFVAVLSVLLVTLCSGSATEHAPDEILSRVRRQTDDSCAVADLIFVLDSSGSIGQENWDRVLNFTRSIVSEFPIGPEFVQIGVNYYGNDATLAFNLNDYGNLANVSIAISSIPWLNQNTNTSGGIRLMYRDMFTGANGARSGIPRIGIIITDGESTFDRNLTIPEADNARDAGIILFAIGIGNKTSQEELRGIADDPSDQFVFNADSFEALGAIQQEIVETTCTVVAECTESADWVFILDASGSVGGSNFRMMTGFLRNLTQIARIDEGDARLGVMTYSNNANILWNLNTYSTRLEIVNALGNVDYNGGTTNTAGALRTARDVMFTPENGDRPERSNVIVIFTDGGSNVFIDTMEEARLTRLAGIKIFVVAVSNWVNMDEIREVASDPDNMNIFMVNNYNEIFTIFDNLKNAVCNDRNECRNRPCRNGGQCIKEYGTYACICPDGFAGINCEIACPNPADVVLVLDGSSSMGRTNYYRIQDFAKYLVRHLNMGGESGQSVGVVTFGDSAVKRIDLGEYSQALRMVDAMSYPFSPSTTNSADAIRMLIDESFTPQNGDDATVRNIAVIFTDGESTDRQLAFAEAARAHAQGISILAVGVDVKGKYAREELRAFSSDPDEENFSEVQDLEDLFGLGDKLIRAICNDVNECASSPCQGVGSICVDKLNGYECLCAEGRSGSNCERACDGRLDIIFAIDASGSIQEGRFAIVLQFVADVISSLEVRTGRAHVGAVTFADDAVTSFPLGRYALKEDILQAVRSIAYTRGRTNIAAALRMIRNNLFTTENGDREDSPNIVILITDGQSTMERENTLVEAMNARMDGIHIIVGSVENDPNSLELRGLASRPVGSNIFNVDRFSELGSIVDALSLAMCDDVNECSVEPCQAGQCVDLLHAYRCVCPDTVTGINCERQCTNTYDVALVLDASGSVDYDYELAQETARYLAMGLNFNQGRTRLGVITYQTDPVVRFQLDSFTTQLEVTNAIAYDNDMGIIGTNTASALRAMRNEVFTSGNGDRNGVQNLAIFVSDGRSNREQDRTAFEADLARRDGVRIVSIGIGTDVNRQEMEAVGDSPASENVYYIATRSDMEPEANRILDLLCA